MNKEHEHKFDLKKIMNRQPKMKVTVTEKNKPNLDLMARVIFDFLIKNK